MTNETRSAGVWPALPYAEWKDTYATLHRWLQVVGKVRMAREPLINHWWQVPLYVDARGLTTSLIADDARPFEIRFDFIDHLLQVDVIDGERRTMRLMPRTVADFHRELMAHLDALDLHTEITTLPCELDDATRFERDDQHASYDAEYANRCWRILVQSHRVMTEFRARFIGKVSPVHVFWGAFDLAVTRFSGRTAPPHPGGAPHVDVSVMREAYSHEVSSAGFWPGGVGLPEPVYYAYAYPEPAGFADVGDLPAGAYYHPTMREFVLPYEIVRTSSEPDALLLRFLQATYESAADRAHWNRRALERGA